MLNRGFCLVIVRYHHALGLGRIPSTKFLRLLQLEFNYVLNGFDFFNLKKPCHITRWLSLVVYR